MKKEETKQVYHPYNLWEDHKHGFYDNISGRSKTEMIHKVVELFSNPTETNLYMNRVIKEWKFSCEHNFTNPSINKVAYLGQAACSLYAGVPSTVTMEAWHEVPQNYRDTADQIANDCIDKWTKNYEQCQK
jgi:hypothetical protein